MPNKGWKTPTELWDQLAPLAKEKRRTPTDTEHIVWELVRGKQLNGYQFRRQHPIGRYIADFYCARARLVIEVDGSSHNGREMEDRIREDSIREFGLNIIRFTNDEVKQDIEKVRQRILKALDSSGA